MPDVHKDPNVLKEYKQRKRSKANRVADDLDQEGSDKVFSPPQFQALVASLPEFINKVNEFDPHWAGNCHRLTAWKKAQCNRFLDSPPFANIPEDMTNEIREAIMRKYSNFFNYNMKKLLVGKPNNFTVAPPSHPALIAFTGTANPRQLFMIKNQAEIQDRYRTVAKEEGIPAVAAYQRVLKEMWDEADHDEWANKAQELESDVEMNRTEFAVLIQDAFNDLLQRGGLGTCALSLSYAWRNERNEIEGGKVHSAFDSNSDQLIDYFHYDDDENAQHRWADYVNSILPRETAVISTAFERTESGLPLFPKVDLKKITVDVLTEILDDYFLALWDHIQEGAAEVPWDKIEEHPWRYFDDTHFLFPKKLRRPSSLDLDEIFPIVKYLIASAASEDPFTFYNNDNIQEAEKSLEERNSASPTLPPTFQAPGLNQNSESVSGVSQNTPAPTMHPTAPLSPVPGPIAPAAAEPAQKLSTITTDVSEPQVTPAATASEQDKPIKKRGRRGPVAPAAAKPAQKLSTDVSEPQVTPAATANEQDKSIKKRGRRGPIAPAAAEPAQKLSTITTDVSELQVTPAATANEQDKPVKKRGRRPKAVSHLDTKSAAAATLPPNISGPAPGNGEGSANAGGEGRRHVPERKRKVPSFRPEFTADPTKPPRKKLKLSEKWVYEPIVE